MDKADIEFPNDLLHELDTMEFSIPETAKPFGPKSVQLSSSHRMQKKSCPMRFAAVRVHYIAFPEAEGLEQIIRVHYPNLEAELRAGAGSILRVRDLPESVKPSTSELLDWIQALQLAGIPAESIEKELPFLGTLLKKEQDRGAFQRRWRAGRV